MTGKEMYNVIQVLEVLNATDEQIVKAVKFVETSDPAKLEELKRSVEALTN
ncbi:MAG: hypothetical protein NC299_09125 [Lachnospiraceae bacterium]|nr:hypothetical protein [Ruminococcus sp.]MCM1275514.1 hypothetical protein [Lachnospiraceae bacterium]